jgi:hypothetical protein
VQVVDLNGARWNRVSKWLPERQAAFAIACQASIKGCGCLVDHGQAAQ